jgi:hypothetical protein
MVHQLVAFKEVVLILALEVWLGWEDPQQTLGYNRNI